MCLCLSIRYCKRMIAAKRAGVDSMMISDVLFFVGVVVVVAVFVVDNVDDDDYSDLTNMFAIL